MNTKLLEGTSNREYLKSGEKKKIEKNIKYMDQSEKPSHQIRESRIRCANHNFRYNRSIHTLTEEQHAALATICTMRHSLHVNRGTLYDTHSKQYKKLWRYIDPSEPGGALINIILRTVGLDEISFLDKREDTPNSEDTKGLSGMYAAKTAFDAGSRANQLIEDYLLKIDKEHGTTYCPNRCYRISDDESFQRFIITMLKQ